MTKANNTAHPPVETNAYQLGQLWAEDEESETDDDDYYDSSVIWVN